MTFLEKDLFYDVEEKTENQVKLLISTFLANHSIQDISVRTVNDLRTAQVLRSKRIEIEADFQDSQRTTKFNYGVANVTISAATAKALIGIDGSEVKTILGYVRTAFIGELPEILLNGGGIRVYSNSMRIRESFKTTENEKEFRRKLLVTIPLHRED